VSSSVGIGQGNKRVSQYRGPTYGPGTAPPQRGSELSDQDIAKLRESVPDLPTPLPNGYLACPSCGIAVAYPGDEMEIIRLECYGREGQPQPVGRSRPPAEILFARCPDCARREALAQ
jgi:hypothetical protein